VVALGLLTFIILRLFDRLINRPISRLKDQMKRVQEGDLTVRLESRTDDEIGSLTRSFNAMVENLKTANQRIEDLYNQRIEKAEHLAAFGELAAGLAHEVKNPLSGMKGALEIIDRATPASNPHKEIFQEILVQTEKIITIIQDFLSYARPKTPHFRRVSPNFFVEDAVRLAKTQVRGKDIAFDIRQLPDGVVIRLDPDKMQEVLLNLILNSISAVDARGRISIGLSASPETGLVIQVTDDGIGMSPAQIAQIFVPFFSTKKDGTGLGLSICRKTVEAHGGTMAVESREGRGTTFTIRLPFDGPKD
jgi:signal transduction histidine kinase